ncbi:MAG: GNAT family N-acetyltransferase [Bacillota bacterium]|nr:GNAT family N-acetyltransferase [Bacillota bacterium]
MFKTFEKSDGFLDSFPFIADEVRANPIHRIAAEPDCTMLIDDNENMICAFSSKLPAWIWHTPELNGFPLRERLAELAAILSQAGVSKVLSIPETAKEFALYYQLKTGLSCSRSMELMSYYCDHPLKPFMPEGKIVPATFGHMETVKAFCDDFWKQSLHSSAALDATARSAESMIDHGGLYLWEKGSGVYTAMANIVYRSPRHGRINSIYTLPEYREQHFGAALVYRLSEIVLAEGLTPILFTDAVNESSNNMVRSIGFTAAGAVNEMTFHRLR